MQPVQKVFDLAGAEQVYPPRALDRSVMGSPLAFPPSYLSHCQSWGLIFFFALFQPFPFCKIPHRVEVITMHSQAFSERLIKANYDLNNPLDAARFQQTVFEFMKLVKGNSLGDPNGAELMDQFCKFVDDKQVWHLAQTVVPEFRSSREEQYASNERMLSLSLCTKIASRVSEHTEGEGHSCLSHVLSKLSLLPPPRNDRGVLSREQELVSQMHRDDVAYLVTGGRGKRGATASELDEIENSCRQVEAEMRGML